MLSLNSEFKKYEIYIKKIEEFYNVLSQIAYKKALNEAFGSEVEIFDSENEQATAAAKNLLKEVKKLPAEMLHPGVIDHMNMFLEKKFDINETS